MRWWLAGAGVAVLLACAGCRGTAGSVEQPTAVVTQDNAGSGTSDDQPGSQLDQLQSTLDSVQAQLNADSGS